MLDFNKRFLDALQIPADWRPRLPRRATPEDLMKFSTIRLKTKRARKKFLKNPSKYVGRSILREYLGNVMAQPILDGLERESVARRCFQLEEIKK